MPHTEQNQTEMEFVEIPQTSIRVSRVALGTWAMGGWMWGGSDETDAIRTIHAALDSEINLIDTAPVYGFGRSEEIVGKALAIGGRRKDTVIATKVGLDWADGKPFRNASRARIVYEAEQSLRRLQTDVIDLYQVHWPDPNTPIAEVAEAMATLYGPEKFAPSGSAISARHRWTSSVPLRRCIPLNRPTICSNAASSRTCCPIAAITTSPSSPMARCAAACSPAA